MDVDRIADQLEARLDELEPYYDYPLADVIASARDANLQRSHNIEAAQAEFASGLPNPPEYYVWIYFRSPAFTWEMLCGREGWFVIDPETLRPQAFIITLMN